MQEKILIATATPGYGELIRQTINEQIHFNAVLVKSGQEVLPVVKLGGIGLCVIDAELVGKFTSILIERIRHYLPTVKIVIIPPDNDPDSAWVSDIKVDAYIKKPFYLPDLMRTIESCMPEKTAQVVKPSPSSPSKNLVWLQDPSKAAQYLTSLSLSCSAQAALIIKDSSMWAYAGQLSQPAAQELVMVVSNDWHHKTPSGSRKPSKEISNLTRFIRLGADGGEYILYAARLGYRMVLALAFNVETPFSTVRTQASELVKALSKPPSSVKTEVNTKRLMEQAELEKQISSNLAGVEKKLGAGQPLWDDVPPPLLNRTLEPAELPNTNIDLPPELDLLGMQLSEGEFPDQTLLPLEPPSIAMPVGSSRSPLNAESNSIWDLAYSCILVPRMPQHFLMGDLAQKITEWLGQLCIAFGWRLEYLSMLPDYMQLVVNVPPNVSPSQMIRSLRQHTSRRIFSTFSNLADENPSGDFWAPGYLVMSVTVQPAAYQEEAQYLPEDMVKDFIHKTRQNQGITGSSPLNYSR
jgi:putative transposase